MPSSAPAAATTRRLVDGAAAWRTRAHADLAVLARSCRAALFEAADELVAASVVAKGWRDVPASPAEEWISGPLPVARFLRCAQRMHEAFAAGRAPSLAFAAGSLLAGCRVRVDRTNDAPLAQPEPRRHGDVALVLGAGNVTATPLLDVLHQVFLEGRAVVLKPSPLHDPLAPIFVRALQPLVAADLLKVQCGDADAARAMCADPTFAAIHVTGSATTWAALHDAPQLAGRTRTAEVGCCTPVLVLPGPYAERELQRIATAIAQHVACNGGATCLAPRVLLTARGWPQRPRLLAMLHERLAAMPARRPFHPSSRADWIAAAGAEPADDVLQPTLRRDLDPRRDAALWTREHFTPVLLDLPIEADTPHSFVERAAAFVREQVFGSLAAYVFAGRSVDRALVDAATRALPHGTVAVNCWAGIGYGLATVPWGVPAGRPWRHGTGFTRGTACVAHVERVVIETPLQPFPRPPWLAEDGRDLARSLTRHWLRPSIPRLATTAFHALRSR